MSSMRGKTGKHLEILQELESDDELPDVYNDATILPAYLVDNRFDDINFAWINLSEEQTTLKTSYDKDQYLQQNENYMRGILTRQDLYCLKSVETLTCSTTLVWFANFLLHKDLQSRYKYLRSCLVNDLSSYIPLASVNNKNDEIKYSNSRLEVVIKL